MQLILEHKLFKSKKFNTFILMNYRAFFNRDFENINYKANNEEKNRIIKIIENAIEDDDSVY